MNKLFALFAAVVFLALSQGAARAQAIPFEPGQYSWKVEGGEIKLMAARYTNQNSFDNRAYTFYFVPSAGKQLFIVPITGEKPKDTVLTITSSAGGEWLFSDLTLQKIKGRLLLIRASQETSAGWAAPGDLTIQHYALEKGDDEDFPYRFVLQRKSMTPALPRVNVDEILKQETQSAAR